MMGVMVRVSEFYKLGVTQPSLEFLDVDVTFDTKLFVDPQAFSNLGSTWAKECVSLLQDFYGEVLHAVRHADRTKGVHLLARLGESNEVHLGLSSAESEGSGVAGGIAGEIFEALSASRAVTSGLLADVQETVLFVEGVGHDRVSDMTINIVRRQLILFTQEMCNQYGIPMVQGVDSGPMWDRVQSKWVAEHVRLPMPNGKKLLLVPKGVVRKTSTFDPGDYLQHFVLPYLQDVELNGARSGLVQRRKSGQPFVTKKSIVERDGKPTKEWNNEVTDQHPELLDEYRAAKAAKTEPPDHEDIAVATHTPQPNWDGLLAAVLAIPSGRDHADNYHRAVQHLLTALFYPALDFPEREFKIHVGRKRIDITYTNVAESGFFAWLHTVQKVSSGMVVIECKNYTGKMKNEEFDQLTGRFSPHRGRFGILCYRGFKDDKAAVIQHCRDAALDDRGFVVALDDEDLAKLVESRKDGEMTLFRYLTQRFRELI